MSVGNRNRKAVAESAYTGHRSEIMIERPVFLHQYDNMLDILDGTGTVIGFNGKCFADSWRQKGDGSCGPDGSGDNA
ncbi:hypothetical protein GALL_536740 [mine drainage metagenome]|uniref:Uncharacterized protein n=1 Tax=mine drainage metagenome TaxID=410659 RepID=A0A1J5PAD6_9ZZZZ